MKTTYAKQAVSNVRVRILVRLGQVRVCFSVKITSSIRLMLHIVIMLHIFTFYTSPHI